MVLDFVMLLLVLLPTDRGFLWAIIFFPISEVLTDVIFLVEVIEGLLATGFLVGPAAFVGTTLLVFVMFFLALLTDGRVVFGLTVFLPISEVLTDLTGLTLLGEDLLVMGFLTGAAAFGGAALLVFVMVLLVLLATGRTDLAGALLI